MPQATDRYYAGWGPRLSHLVKPGGLSGEVLDLRQDIELALRNVATESSQSSGSTQAVEQSLTAVIGTRVGEVSAQASAELGREVGVIHALIKGLPDFGALGSIKAELTGKAETLSAALEGQIVKETSAINNRIKGLPDFGSLLSLKAEIEEELRAASAVLGGDLFKETNKILGKIKGLPNFGALSSLESRFLDAVLSAEARSGNNTASAEARLNKSIAEPSTLKTADATPTIIKTITPPTNTLLSFEATVLARRKDGLEAAKYILNGYLRAVHAFDTLTLSVGIPTDGQNVVVGVETYVWKTVLTGATPFEVLIGGTIELSIDNLVLAIMLTGTPDVEYDGGTTKNGLASARKDSATTMQAVALDAGTAGNSIAATETMTNGVWGNTGAGLAGGSDLTIENETITAIDEDDASWNVTAAAVGTGYEISVTGAADKDVDWTIFLRDQHTQALLF